MGKLISLTTLDIYTADIRCDDLTGKPSCSYDQRGGIHLRFQANFRRFRMESVWLPICIIAHRQVLGSLIRSRNCRLICVDFGDF